MADRLPQLLDLWVVVHAIVAICFASLMLFMPHLFSLSLPKA